MAAQRAGWLACGAGAVPAGAGWLSAGEAARAATLRHPKRRTEYLLRRYTAKRAAAAVLDLAPGDLPPGWCTQAAVPGRDALLRRIEVGNAPGGAPYVLLDGSPAGVAVSLTDRAGWAVCLAVPAGAVAAATPAGAVAAAIPAGAGDVPGDHRSPAAGAVPGDHRSPAAGAVGCDLELVEPRSAGFLSCFLTPAERRWVASRAGDARAEAANAVWSAKESALKLLRTGLDRDTRTVAVTLDAAPGAGGVDGPDGGDEPYGVRGAGGPSGVDGRDGPAGGGGGDGRHGGYGVWRPLSVATAEGRFPGWWRRDGAFVLTVVTGGPAPAPACLGDRDALVAAVPDDLIRPPRTPDRHRDSRAGRR